MKLTRECRANARQSCCSIEAARLGFSTSFPQRRAVFDRGAWVARRSQPRLELHGRRDGDCAAKTVRNLRDRTVEWGQRLATNSCFKFSGRCCGGSCEGSRRFKFGLGRRRRSAWRNIQRASAEELRGFCSAGARTAGATTRESKGSLERQRGS